MAQERVPLFVRLPQEQAAALDRLVGSTGRRKQQLVSELLGERLGVGRIDIREGPPSVTEAVLTLEDVAALLRLPVDAVSARARAGELPGRLFDGEWRFARDAVLEWLADGEKPAAERASEHGDASADG
jgi:Arc/MetJ-type ribon-helix-helix transcriptional regulator